MNTYTLVLKKLTSQGKIPVISFNVETQDNMLALMDGHKYVCNYLRSDGYELIDAGMVGEDVSERILTFIKDDDTYDYILTII